MERREVEVAAEPRHVIARRGSRQRDRRTGGDRRQVQETLRQHRLRFIDVGRPGERFDFGQVLGEQLPLEQVSGAQGQEPLGAGAEVDVQVIVVEGVDGVGELASVGRADFIARAGQFDDGAGKSGCRRRGGARRDNRRGGRPRRRRFSTATGRQRQRQQRRPAKYNSHSRIPLARRVQQRSRNWYCRCRLRVRAPGLRARH